VTTQPTKLAIQNAARPAKDKKKIREKQIFVENSERLFVFSAHFLLSKIQPACCEVETVGPRNKKK
jgi:hypothetical protein